LSPGANELGRTRGEEEAGRGELTASVIIDRLRLLELLNELPDDELEQLPDAATRGWVEAELASLA
jgi:hypothetical protein